jgi:hypothetical protein
MFPVFWERVAGFRQKAWLVAPIQATSLLSEVLGGLVYFSAPGLMTGTARFRIPVRGVARLPEHLRFPYLHQQDGTANHVCALL